MEQLIMGRHKKMASASIVRSGGFPSNGVADVIDIHRLDSPPLATVLAGYLSDDWSTQLPLVAAEPVIPSPPSVPDRPDAAQRLTALMAHSLGSGVHHSIHMAAAHATANASRAGLQADLRVMSDLGRLFLWDLDVHSTFDPLRALKRQTVDEYLRRGLQPSTTGTRRTVKSRIYHAGRALYPNQYPEPNRLADITDRSAVQAPTDPAEIRRAYRLADSLGEQTAATLRLFLDLTTGVGARAEEILRVRPEDISLVTIDGRRWTTVKLTNRRKLTRAVPVVEDAKGKRLAALAERRAGHERLVPGTGKNMINQINARVRRRGQRLEFTAVSLRHAWIVDLAQRSFPTADLIDLADLACSDTLTQLSAYMRRRDHVAVARSLMAGS